MDTRRTGDAPRKSSLSREYLDGAEANLKTFLLTRGYSGAGEDQFDALLADIRSNAPDVLRRRETGT